MTMKEIGLTLGVVESRVSQIHASAVLHLRSMLADLAARSSNIKSIHNEKLGSKRTSSRKTVSARE
jgi:RNA polymerase sigma factor for flagellar operon FliA